MDDCENIWRYLLNRLPQLLPEQRDLKLKLEKLPGFWERKSMTDIWKEKIGINLENYLTQDKMFNLCLE